MFQIQIRVLAKEDIQSITDYYDLKASYITDIFLENLYAELDIIANKPELFQEKYRKTRVRYLKKFPFGIHYTLKDQIIVVLAVLHTSRNPQIWKKRD